MAKLNFDFSVLSNTSEKKYTYRDVNMEFNKNTSGFYSDSYDTEAIANSINNIFRFIPGERILLPTFANEIFELLFQPVNSHTAHDLNQSIERMIGDWEPRVILKTVSVVPVHDEYRYNVSVEYTIPTLDDVKLYQYGINLEQQN